MSIITSITTNSVGSFTVGDVIVFTVAFNLTGFPPNGALPDNYFYFDSAQASQATIGLQLSNGVIVSAIVPNGGNYSPSLPLIFSYTVGAGEDTTNLTVGSDPLVMPATASFGFVGVLGTADSSFSGGDPNGSDPLSISTPDTTPPTVLSITDDEGGVANIAGGDVVYTVTFSEDVSGFDASALTVTGGTIGTIAAVTGTSVYIVVVTPDGNSTTNIDFAVNAGSVTDGNGNSNAAGLSATAQAVDTVAPLVLSIVDDESGVANIPGGDVVYTVTFSDDVSGFDASALTVTGGTIGTIAAVTGTSVYTVV